MAVKAELKIRLLANKVLVAESEDEDLWRRVLAAIQGATGALKGAEADGGDDQVGVAGAGNQNLEKGVSGVEGWARELGVSAAEIQGACSPAKEPPFVHLDPRSWEAFKKNTPKRGPGSVAPIQLAATLLGLWFKHAGVQGRPTQAQAQAVLGTVGLRDGNPSRSIRNCDWLQSRSDGTLINPAQHSKAITVARSYITRQPAQTE